MNKTWQDERKEIAVWLSGYLAMVKKWVDKILDNDVHDVSKNQILAELDRWIEYLQEEKQKIMMMRDTPIPEEKVETNEYGDNGWATPPEQ